ncbi:MAG: glutaredoxin family protein [Candidatus Hydrogenedentes bacterium]|nr:glutaredoxin family protein [Candidatus Hydrogenedentota bacterium]
MGFERQITVYSAALCGDCQRLKAWMEEQGIQYENRDIREHPHHARELEEQTGKLGVPYLIIDGQWKRGYVPGQEFSPDFARSLFE